MGRPKGTIPPNAGKGRPKGVPNKSTRIKQEVFAELFRQTSVHFKTWVDQVASGMKEFEIEKDENGAPVLDPKTGEPKGEWNWLKIPDPEKAMKLALEAAEFHKPKLARVEHTDGEGKPLPVVQVTFVKK
jgi:hypothetical protein